MNTYLVPMWNRKNNELKEHLALINAENRYEAMLIAIGSHNCLVDKNGWSIDIPQNEKWHIDMDYKKYIGFNNSEEIFTYMSNNVTIKPSKSTEEDWMELYNYMYWGNYNAQMQALADKAIPEKWSFEGKNDFAILKNYLENTFIQLQKEDKVIETDSYCLFNTGLFTDHYVPIYVYGELNKKYTDDSAAKKWQFKGFKNEYDLASLDIEIDYPERADYFKDTTLLVFDWHCKIHVNYDHILEDLGTYKRLPDCIKNSDRPLDSLKGYIDTAIQRVTANYKLAVPHYYQDKIQLMIPLCFNKNDIPDVALVLDKRNGNHYQARTCLTMEMAYMDARLIAKPESNWLIAENITED